MVGIVVVFDFDKTIIDSDNWVVDELGATDLLNDLLPTMPWNSLTELHARGKTIEDIADVFKRIPIHPIIVTIVPAIKAAHALGCDLRIVSDANTFFIETILKHLELREKGIFPYHDSHRPPHGCSLCPPNMCKGLIIERIQASVYKEEEKFIYLGDGSGDYCPSLKLGDVDHVMPRKDFPGWDLIYKKPLLIKAEIHDEWIDGEDLERILLGLINKVSIEETDQFISAEYKLQTISVCPHESLPKALPVQQ
ncbi:hypothetical protein I3842_02G138600 [Carya illinoinensis]|uniref:Phosphatase n=1 Tax=Carya illinoinensis TaxID=32201 RepID=A0A922FVW6_CARIL|nr:hypothetical protein I3842_02G138600 [Carya illinoinensis]